MRYMRAWTAIERLQSQEAFIYDKVGIIVATNAFGMGIDKSNVRYVIHYNMPATMDAYYRRPAVARRTSAGVSVLRREGHNDREVFYIAERGLRDKNRHT